MNIGRLTSVGSNEKGHRMLTYQRFLMPLWMGVLAFALTVGSGSISMAFGKNAESAALYKSSWLAWTGCWELVSESVDRLDEMPGIVLVCLSPHPDGKSVQITTLAEGERPFEETFLADGVRYPVNESECQGWRSAEWSRDGHRLFISSEVSCKDNKRKVISGLSMLRRNGKWMDIQVIGSEGVRELVVRQYRRADAETAKDAGFEGFPFGREDVSAAWREASQPLTVDDVIEAGNMINPVVVEAALMESESEIPVDAEALVRMSDAGVDAEIIDLMIALANPNRFVIGRMGYVSDGSSSRRSSGGGGAGFGSGFFYDFFGPYPYYDPYAYYYPFYYAPFAYYGYSYLNAPHYGSHYFLTPADNVADSQGRVVKGKGYTRVQRAPTSSSGDGRGRGMLAEGSGYSSRDSSSHGKVGSKGYSSGGRSRGTAKPKNKN